MDGRPPESICELAIRDPVRAFAELLHIPHVPISMNATASFSSFALNQVPLDAALDTTIVQRTWIDNVEMHVDQPNVFAGNVFKTLYDAQLKENPGIQAQIAVHSGPRYITSNEFTPIECIVARWHHRWPSGWPLFKDQSIEVLFNLVQAPPGVSPNGPPYNVTLTFNGWQYLDHSIDNISADDAARCLRAEGIWVPDTACLRKSLADFTVQTPGLR